jgi:hypothetical protein
MAVLSETAAILPEDKTNADDLLAAEAVRAMIAGCENWTIGLTHLLDATLWPVAVCEKIFQPAEPTQGGKVSLRFKLHRLEPVDPALLCFRKLNPYGNAERGTRNAEPAAAVEDSALPAPRSAFEEGLRFYRTAPSGRIDYNLIETYAAEEARHLVHRGHLLQSLPDCWGGPMRAIVFWWLLGVLGRDWFARMMERYGNPFLVGRTNSRDKEAVTFLQEAFSLATKVGGLVVDVETQIELKEAAVAGGADAFERFLGVCNREISKAIVGQELSATAASTGLGSSVGKLQSDVRDDIRRFDQQLLGEVLRRQLFAPFLQINGLRGAPPRITWGGLTDTDAKAFADLLEGMTRAGFEPTDEAIPTICDRVGFQVRRKSAPVGTLSTASPTSPRDEDNGDGVETVPTTREPAEDDPPDPGDDPAEDPPTPRRLAASPALRLALSTYSAQAKAADALGVPVAWLAPVREILGELERKAADKTLSDGEMLDALDALVKRMPELFAEMDLESLARMLEAGMGGAVVDSVRQGIREHTATHSGNGTPPAPL